ncbi:MAG TPA: alpha/beta hydrolase [Chlamydiales bacterium]|nr:alpha/beta hydrolase [Chlamydiales bacterium]
MLFFTSNQLRLHYKIQGTGPRLVFIPGMASDLRQELNVFQSPLVEQFEVLSFDPRGIGQSTSPDEEPTMRDCAKDVKQLLDHIGWGKCHCVGESFGGMIAQEFALQFSAYVERLVLVVTSSGGEGGSSFPFHEHDISKMTLEQRADFWVRCGDARYTDLSWKKTEIYKQQYKTYLEVFRLGAENPQRKLFSERQIAARKLHNTFERLPNLRMPVYIAGGRYDKTAPVENQMALWRQIPRARLTFFEGSHMLLWQDPFAFQSIAAFCSLNS